MLYPIIPQKKRNRFTERDADSKRMLLRSVPRRWWTVNLMMFVFFGLLLVSAIVYYCVPLKRRWIVLLVFSLLFYAVISTYLIVFILSTALSVFLVARFIGKEKSEDETPEEAAKRKKRNKALVVIAIVGNLAILGFLKYFNFLGDSVCSLLRLFGANVRYRPLRLILPLGISFYTLQAIGYLLDVHRKKYAPEKNFAKLLLFLSFFPQILEGPICRYDQTAAQLIDGNRADYRGIAFGVQRILWGLFKKMVVADRIYVLVSTVNANPSAYSGVASLLFILGYTLYLYADFSGFIDMALGAGEVFGVKLPENFRQPFFASSAQEFWQRWHITLGTWLKEYVFYSVALSPRMMRFGKWLKKKRKNHFTKTLPTGVALLAVWLCNGLWHGPEWKYIVYGLYYFVIIFSGMLAAPLFAKLYEKIKLKPDCIGLRIFRHIRTLLIIFVGETIFGANTLGDAVRILGSVFRPYHGSIFGLGLDYKEFIVLLFGVAVMLTVGILKERKIDVREKVASAVLPLRWVAYSAVVVCIVLFGAYGWLYGMVPFAYGGF